MQYIGFLICLFVLWGTSSAAKSNFFKFEDCGGKHKIANVSTFELSPDPVNLRKNLTVNMDLDILQDVPEKAVLRTRYYKLKNVFGIHIDVPIPCLLGKFGSCSMPLCKYLKLYKEQAEPVFPEGTEYGCPVKAGHYGGSSIEIQIPDMGSIARLIVSGKYRTELELVADGKVLACYRIFSEMK